MISQKNKISKNNYDNLITNLGSILEEGRQQVYRVINDILVKTYWEIGKQVEKGEFWMNGY